MKYTGKLYGKIAGRTFDTGRTAHDFDGLFNSLKSLIDYLEPSKFSMNNEFRLLIEQGEEALKKAGL